MENFYVDYLMQIFDCFYFLIHENYSVKHVALRIGAYPDVTYKNYQTGIFVEIAGQNLGCEGEHSYVGIGKFNFFSSYIIDVTKTMNKLYHYDGHIKTIPEYADFVQKHLMPVIRGEQDFKYFMKDDVIWKKLSMWL